MSGEKTPSSTGLMGLFLVSALQQRNLYFGQNKLETGQHLPTFLMGVRLERSESFVFIYDGNTSHSLLGQITSICPLNVQAISKMSLLLFLQKIFKIIAILS